MKRLPIIVLTLALCLLTAGCGAKLNELWDGQAKGETPLANHKLHAARFRVCVGLAALAGVSCGIGGQPVLEVGVVGADMDKGVFLVKPNISGLFLLRKPCSHKLSFLPSVAQEWHFSVVFSGS